MAYAGQSYYTEALASIERALKAIQVEIKTEQLADSYYEAYGIGGIEEMKSRGVIDKENVIQNLDGFFEGFDDFMSEDNVFHFQVFANQPGEGRDPYTGGNGGHAWIEIGATRPDGTKITRNIGFFPENTSDVRLISGKDMKSTLRADVYNYNNIDAASFEVEISKEELSSAINKVYEYSNTKYDLDDNNCADFVINVGNSANVQVPDTFGHFLGSKFHFGGSNPADLGQDLIDMGGELES